MKGAIRYGKSRYYYTSDQNMNTENYSTGGNQDQGPKKNTERAPQDGQKWYVQDWFGGCKCGISDK